MKMRHSEIAWFPGGPSEPGSQVSPSALPPTPTPGLTGTPTEQSLSLPMKRGGGAHNRSKTIRILKRKGLRFALAYNARKKKRVFKQTSFYQHFFQKLEMFYIIFVSHMPHKFHIYNILKRFHILTTHKYAIHPVLLACLTTLISKALHYKKSMQNDYQYKSP